MASSRITGTSETVSTYGTGKDYTSLSTWESATDNDLVTSTTSEVLECYDTDASFNDTIDLNGATTNASYFRIIRPATGEGHDGTPNNGVSFFSTAADNLWNNFDDYTSIQDVIGKITTNSASTFLGGLANSATANEGSFIGCIMVDLTNAGAGDVQGFYNVNNTSTYAVNCLVANGDAQGFQSATGGVFYVFNCTAEGGARGYYPLTNSTMQVINCIETNNTSTGFTGTYASGSNYNASEDTSAPGANSRTSQTFTFVNAAGDDYHLDATDGGALDFGIDQSGNGNFAYDDDIDGDTIVTWSIGIDSHVAAVARLGILSYHQRSVYPGLSS